MKPGGTKTDSLMAKGDGEGSDETEVTRRRER